MDNEIVKYISTQINESKNTIGSMMHDEFLLSQVDAAVKLCINCIKNGGKIILAGNGGSAADAQHIAAEFVSKFFLDRPGMSAIALTTDTSILTAISNDYGYEKVFARQMQAIGQKGDVFIGYSTSGKSKNILLAFEEAESMGITCIGLTGSDSNQMGKLCDCLLKVPSAITSKIQEGHLVLGHIICDITESTIFGGLD